ncbi:hypothetical protein OGAPHI_001416 [Ogataea philodendri]|uniref:Secreted protein n=1 Tax=Ogataea philodendri TaxID=1378263 RepID=A0A9P8PCX6_9ASCO|nr:uncharacterized protein OGAPHI_001416 [Ogataea philodendri]KAH3669295.1 hypothetical protein OGAPHI_001416 [Ogataea philodendri]
MTSTLMFVKILLIPGFGCCLIFNAEATSSFLGPFFDESDLTDAEVVSETSDDFSAVSAEAGSSNVGVLPGVPVLFECCEEGDLLPFLVPLGNKITVEDDCPFSCTDPLPNLVMSLDDGSGILSAIDGSGWFNSDDLEAGIGIGDTGIVCRLAISATEPVCRSFGTLFDKLVLLERLIRVLGGNEEGCEASGEPWYVCSLGGWWGWRLNELATGELWEGISSLRINSDGSNC